MPACASEVLSRPRSPLPGWLKKLPRPCLIPPRPVRSVYVEVRPFLVRRDKGAGGWPFPGVACQHGAADQHRHRIALLPIAQQESDR